LLGGPQVPLLFGGRGLEPTSVAIALALTAACFAVAASAFGDASGAARDLPGRLWPALASVAALLLVLPEPSLTNVRTDVVLLAAPVMTGVGAAWFCSDERGEAGNYWRAGFALVGAALVFGVAMVVQAAGAARSGGSFGAGFGLSVSALAAEAPLVVLSVVALGRSGGTRWSAQFTVVPLIVLLEGVALARPTLDWRLLTGLALLALASLGLLFPPEDEEMPVELA
jgi:hypothetical protein